jgi:hypothetical protein
METETCAYELASRAMSISLNLGTFEQSRLARRYCDKSAYTSTGWPDARTEDVHASEIGPFSSIGQPAQHSSHSSRSSIASPLVLAFNDQNGARRFRGTERHVEPEPRTGRTSRQAA